MRLVILRVLSVNFLAALLAIGVCERAYSAKKVYDFKSAEIEMMTVDPMSNVTTEIVRIDKWGEFEARHRTRTIKMLGIEQKNESITFTDRNENVVYDYDPETNEATKVDMSEVLKSMKNANKQYVYSEGALKEWGGKKVRTEDFLGLKCDVVEFSQLSTTVWFYKKFPVKSQTNMGAMKVQTEAVRFEEEVSFAKKDVALPKGVKIVDAPDIGKIMSRGNSQKSIPRSQGENEDSGTHSNDELDPEVMPQEMPDMGKAMNAFETMKKRFRNLDE
ncbi:MAG: hypothetical protein GY941_10760 [Planctomycetes bacterium]|nr:hypothetical protein [Planctomycetota bacterium]